MVKKLLYVFSIVCAFSLFTACSDDDNESNTPDTWEKLSKTYEKEQVKIAMGEVAVPAEGKTVEIKATSAEKATVTLNNIVVENKKVVVETSLKETDGTYSFTGESTVGNCTVSVNGTVKDGVASVVYSRKLTDPIVGSWNMKFIPNGTDKAADIHTLINTGNVENDAQMAGMLKMVGALLAKEVDSVNVKLNENGVLGISWKKTGTDKMQSLDEIAKMINLQYYVADNKFMIAIDKSYVSALTALGKDALNKLGIKMDDILALLVDNGGYYALPLNVKTQDNDAIFYMNKEQILPVLDIVTPLLDKISSPGFEAVKPLVSIVLMAIKNAKEVEFGLVFTK